MPSRRPDIDEEKWSQIQSLFETTVDMSREEQIAYLLNHTEGNPDIRHNVERLLEADTLNHDIILDAIESEASDFLLAAHSGERLGAYRLLEEIGRGGMGSVFLAERADEEYEKRVCIKVLRNKLASQQDQQRFRDERQTLANLQHPNIASLLDGGTREDGTTYLVMEYVDGKPIDQYCNEKKIDIKKRLALFLSVCDAIDYAHRRQVLHCDIKPGNILVTEQGVVKLVDFGVSRLLSDTGSRVDKVEIKENSNNYLTPAYASPEQLKGQQLTEASEVYSLGILLYELLTGINPLNFVYQNEGSISRPSDVLAAASSQTSYQHAEDIPLERQASYRELLNYLIGELDSIIMKALSSSSNQRYQTIAALAKDVGNFLSNRPVNAYDSSVLYPLYKAVHRNRAVTVIVALFVLMTLALNIIFKPFETGEIVTVQKVITAHAMQNKDNRRPTIAILPFEIKSQSDDYEYLADGITEQLIDNLSKLNDLLVIARISILSYKNKVIDLQQIGEELNAQYFVQGFIQNTDDVISIAVKLIDVGRNQTILEELYERPIVDLFILQNEISKKIAENLNVNITETEQAQFSKQYTGNLTAYKYLIEGLKYYGQRFKQANQRAREHFETAIALDPNFARAYAVLANTHRSDYINHWSDDMATSLALAKKLIKQAEILDPDLPQVHFIKGLIYREQKQHSEAMTAAAHAITLNPNYADGLILLASVMCYSGLAENSIALIEKAMHLSPNHPTNYTFHMAQCLFTQGQYTKAVRVFEETLQRNPASQRSILWLAASYANAGQLQQAQWAIDELMSWNPDITLRDVTATVPYSNRKDIDRLLNGLKKAGLQK